MSDEKLPTKIGVYVATPVRHFQNLDDPQHVRFKRTLDELAALSRDEHCPYEFYIALIQGGLVRARNHIAHEFKKLAATTPSLKFMMPWDDDIEATGADFLRLLSHHRPFVTAMYTRREAVAPRWVANFMHEVVLQKGGLLQVIEAGTGLQCVHLQVLTEIERIFPKIMYTDRDSGERIAAYYQHMTLQTDLRPDGDMLTEDYFFCHLCRMARIGIFVDTQCKLKHRGGDGTLYPIGDWPPIPGLTEAEP